MKNEKVELGDMVEDIVTGIQGIVVAHTEWLFGCARVSIQPKAGKEVKAPDLVGTDIGSIRVIKKASPELMDRAGRSKAKTEEPRTGGPRPDPSRGRGAL